MPAFARIAIFLLLLCAGIAHADSWRPPQVETYTSADGSARVTITPRALQGALEYFQDAVDGKPAPGQRAGSTQTRPLARLERRIDGDWRTAWEVPLVNDVGPVNALVANGGRHLVTFDNWHSAGYGDNVVAIYGAQGTLIRKFALKDLLPESYIALLPRTVSSLWWGGEHALADDDSTLVLRVVEPSEEDPFDHEPNTVPVRIRLSDGQVHPFAGPEWERTRKAVDALLAKRNARWQQARALRARPLPVPQGTDQKAWRAYLFELRERLGDATGHPHAGNVLSPQELEGSRRNRLDTLSYLLDGYADQDMRSSDHFIFVAPDSQALADALVRHLSGMKRGALQGATVTLVGTPEQGEQVRAAAERSGAAVVLIDKAVPYPPGALPEEVPEWFQ